MGMLDGKAAVVTNAGQGIGRAVALLIAEEGASVVVHDSEEVAREIRDQGGEAVVREASVTSWEGSHELIQAAFDLFGRLDILVNTVDPGISARGPLISDIGKEDWESTVKAHLKAPFLCTRAASSRMREGRQGRLIYFFFPEGLNGGEGCTHLGAVQMAVAGLSRNAAIEMERYGVTSNCIVPCEGTGCASKPADAAPLAVFLGSDASKGISGQIFGVRGKEVLLLSQPRIQRSIHNSEGWTVEKLAEIFESAMGPHFAPLETSGSTI